MQKAKRNICFRTRGNHKQGMGDITGSLSIAQELMSLGHKVTFIIDDDDEAVDAMRQNRLDFTIVKNGNEGRAWENKYFDAVLVNQLKSKAAQLSIIKSHCRKLVTIDDTGLACRQTADLRINPLYYDKGALCHPGFIPLNRIFQRAHREKKFISSDVRRILVTMGGTDTYGFTPQIVRALSDYVAGVSITVILGPLFQHNNELNRALSETARKFNLVRSLDTGQMCCWMRWADLGICAAGNTLFEMACCGTPVIIICAEKFEEETAYRFEKLGFGKVIPFHKKLDTKKLKTYLDYFKDRSLRRKISETGKKLVDGLGAKRIARKILGLN